MKSKVDSWKDKQINKFLISQWERDRERKSKIVREWGSKGESGRGKERENTDYLCWEYGTYRHYNKGILLITMHKNMLEGMGQFLEGHRRPKLTQEESDK